MGDYCSASCETAQQICNEHGDVPACALSEETEARLESEKGQTEGWRDGVIKRRGTNQIKIKISQSLCPFAVRGQEQSQPTAPEMVQNKQCIFQTLEWFFES